jgi:hypothetical protein
MMKLFLLVMLVVGSSGGVVAVGAIADEEDMLLLLFWVFVLICRQGFYPQLLLFWFGLVCAKTDLTPPI